MTKIRELQSREKKCSPERHHQVDQTKMEEKELILMARKSQKKKRMQRAIKILMK